MRIGLSPRSCSIILVVLSCIAVFAMLLRSPGADTRPAPLVPQHKTLGADTVAAMPESRSSRVESIYFEEGRDADALRHAFFITSRLPPADAVEFLRTLEAAEVRGELLYLIAQFVSQGIEARDAEDTAENAAHRLAYAQALDVALQVLMDRPDLREQAFREFTSLMNLLPMHYDRVGERDRAIELYELTIGPFRDGLPDRVIDHASLALVAYASATGDVPGMAMRYQQMLDRYAVDGDYSLAPTATRVNALYVPFQRGHGDASSVIDGLTVVYEDVADRGNWEPLYVGALLAHLHREGGDRGAALQYSLEWLANWGRARSDPGEGMSGQIYRGGATYQSVLWDAIADARAVGDLSVELALATEYAQAFAADDDAMEWRTVARLTRQLEAAEASGSRD